MCGASALSIVAEEGKFALTRALIWCYGDRSRYGLCVVGSVDRRRRTCLSQAELARTPKPRTTSAPQHPSPSSNRKRRGRPQYLAAELGQPVDQDGEPIGSGSALGRADAELQEYTLQLWRQTQTGRGVPGRVREMEREGFTIDDIWAAGVTEVLSTSSTPDEIRRYKQKLLFRANLLEAILSETVAELRRLDGIEPAVDNATEQG